MRNILVSITEEQFRLINQYWHLKGLRSRSAAIRDLFDAGLSTAGILPKGIGLPERIGLYVPGARRAGAERPPMDGGAEVAGNVPTVDTTVIKH